MLHWYSVPPLHRKSAKIFTIQLERAGVVPVHLFLHNLTECQESKGVILRGSPSVSRRTQRLLDF